MKRYHIYTALLSLLLLSLTSCDKTIYDHGECPTILAFTPYYQTPCMTDSAYLGLVGDIHIVVSDPSSGQIVAHSHLEQADLSATATIELPIANDGGETYRYTIWAGATHAEYTVGDVEPSANLTQSTLALLLSGDRRHSGLLTEPLYFATGTVTCPPILSGSSVRVLVEPNMIRYSNNFNIQITKLPSKVIYPLQIEIADQNAAYDFLGALTNPTQSVIYQGTLPNEGQSRTTSLSTLRLDDPATFPQISLTRTDTGDKIFTYDLKKLLAEMPDYRPECQFEYDIEIQLEELPDNTHYAITILIDGWKVHSYEIEL